MSKLWQIYAWGTISLALIVIGLFIFWYLYPYKPLVINHTPIKVINRQVKAGDLLYYEVDACKNVNLTSHVSRQFVDTIIYNTSLIDVNNPKGCRVTRVGLIIPQLPPGVYFIKNTYTYQMNPVRSIAIEADTETFEIIE